MISRRGFLGLLATGTALAFIPIQLKLGIEHRFDSTQDYGNCLTLRSNERYDNLPPRILNTLGPSYRAVASYLKSNLPMLAYKPYIQKTFDVVFFYYI